MSGQNDIFRIDQMFDIIIDYPESMPALEDLRVSVIYRYGKFLSRGTRE
jgi:hypothetical protein